jgi:hypothetical protein
MERQESWWRVRRSASLDAMKKQIDYGRDDHPADDPERSQLAWAVAIFDDCEGCDDIRVELTLEEVGRPGYGMVAHLSPQTTRRLRKALTNALREVGEDKDS